MDKFPRIFILPFLIYTVIGVIGARIFDSFLITAACLIVPIQVLANQLRFVLMVEDVQFKNVVFFTARIVNPLRTDVRFAMKIIPFGIVSMITMRMLQLNYKVDVLMMPLFGVADDRLAFILWARRFFLWMDDPRRVSRGTFLAYGAL